MEYESVLYIIGLVLVSLYLLTGIDDFIWDAVTLFRRRQYRKQRLDPHKLDSIPPKLLAVAIAAWHEDNVLGAVIENVIASVHYPKSMYHIFLGVYPNDDATIAVAKALEEKYPNVHCIINELPGPTSKAQNINYVIRQIKAFEKERNWQFASLTIHDSEDVVHSYELKVTNYLLQTHAAMQFPVFPILPMPRFRNFFKTITTGTYADEFAENHFSTMVSRYNSGAFVPSAGTGFALSRATIESFGDKDVLPKDSLTEDYRLSLTLFERGIQMYYVLERVPRITNENKLKWDFIATRSIFPNTFKTATKQKTRWILGITMQSFKFRDIFQTKGLRFAGRYSLYQRFESKNWQSVGFRWLSCFDLLYCLAFYSFTGYLSHLQFIVVFMRGCHRNDGGTPTIPQRIHLQCLWYAQRIFFLLVSSHSPFASGMGQYHQYGGNHKSI